ncbi:hypothetical protein [Photobacterium damselae]|uniref:hypothetical protein n=1 Tax=Photobacterium damselae TaxID=38293 RepID=UPI001F27AD04|nr:hypothetical protein [Photobacterium damselae]UKA04947.1 hypothetical protein IHC89_22135 [Photobacterium damselae subsp. damselae]
MTKPFSCSAEAHKNEYITLTCTDKQGSTIKKETYELFFNENDVELKNVPYTITSLEYDALMEELDRVRSDLHNSSDEENKLPERNSDCIQRVVQLNRTVQNKAGELFPKGTVMIITQRHKRDKEVTLRPINGSIRVSEDACDFKGSKEDFGFSPYQ